MNTSVSPQDLGQLQPPSAGKIVAATLVALVVASIILVVVVLPAEYGIDPLKTGKALGLNNLAGATAKPSLPAQSGAADAAGATIVPVLVPSPGGEAPMMKGTFIAQPIGFQSDSRTLVIDPHEGMEIKYHMPKGGGLVYSWTADAILQYEFHGEPNVKPAGAEGTDYYESYELDDSVGKKEGHGTFIAPSTGVHGWFWENMTSSKVTVKLVAAGYFDWVFQNRKDKESAFKTIDPSAWPSHPTLPDQEVH